MTIAQDSSFPDNGKFFVPSEISIAPNGTVSWINEDNIIHAVTSGKPRQAPLGAFDSGVINAGSIFNHTFSKIGIFDYFDQIHPHMVGKVIAGLYTYNLKTNKGLSPLSFLITGNGNQIQKINLQSGSPMLEIRMLSPSPGNLTLVIPRTVLDKLDQNGKDDAFGLVGNRPVGFNESSTTPNSRTLAIQFDRGVNYIQILGTKSIEPASKIEKSESVIQNPSIVQSREATKPSGITDNTVINATMAGSNATALEKTAENTTMNGDVIDDGVATTSGGDSVTISPGSSIPSNGKFFVT